MGEGDNLQSAGLTAKELLTEVRTDVKAIARSVDQLVGQNLDGRIHALEIWRDSAAVEGARLVADVTATPVGRALEAGRIENSRRISKLERAVWMSTGALALVVFIANLLPGLLALVLK